MRASQLDRKAAYQDDEGNAAAAAETLAELQSHRARFAAAAQTVASLTKRLSATRAAFKAGSTQLGRHAAEAEALDIERAHRDASHGAAIARRGLYAARAIAVAKVVEMRRKAAAQELEAEESEREAARLAAGVEAATNGGDVARAAVLAALVGKARSKAVAARAAAANAKAKMSEQESAKVTVELEMASMDKELQQGQETVRQARASVRIESAE